MRRREFIGLLGGLAATWPRATRAQQFRKVYRIAVLAPSSRITEMSETGGSLFYRGLFEQLRQLGYVEGDNLTVERLTAGGMAERFTEVAREAVRLQPDAICAVSNRIVEDLKAATGMIPVVGVTSDPVAFGLVASMARPGGNITGVSVDAGLEIVEKRLEILREVVPTMSKVGFLVPVRVWNNRFGRATRDAIQRLGMTDLGPPLNSPVQESEYRRVFAAMAEERADALIVGEAPENITNRKIIVELAEENRLPTIYPWREHVDIGGFMAYAFDAVSLGRQVADSVDRVLRGANPAEIPIYQASKFDLLLNLKTAKALGLEIPPTILARADEVIE